MQFQAYKKKFLKKARKEGFDQLEINRCLNYAEKLLNNGLPVIFDIDHFSKLVGYDEQYIRKAVTHTTAFYRNFNVPKRNGTVRQICEPLPSLKEIQLWLLKQVLEHLPIHPHAKAYKNGISLKENLKFHINQPLVMTLDIIDFFPSITREQVEHIFIEAGYGKKLSNLFAKMCTLSGHLPQGAPTSPYLSNLIFKPIDEELAEYCKANKIRYTRYADDLTFSGEFDPNLLFNLVQSKINGIGMQVHPSKTKVMRNHQQQRVTGMVVNKKMQVPFEKRNRLRQEMYMISKFGLDEHMKHQAIDNKHYLQHLKGQVHFILHLNPRDKEFKNYMLQLNELNREVDKPVHVKSALLTE